VHRFIIGLILAHHRCLYSILRVTNAKGRGANIDFFSNKIQTVSYIAEKNIIFADGIGKSPDSTTLRILNIRQCRPCYLPRTLSNTIRTAVQHTVNPLLITATVSASQQQVWHCRIFIIVCGRFFSRNDHFCNFIYTNYGTIGT